MIDQKNKNTSNVIIVILVVLVIGLSGFIICDKILFQKDNSQDNSNNIK